MATFSDKTRRASSVATVGLTALGALALVPACSTASTTASSPTTAVAKMPNLANVGDAVAEQRLTALGVETRTVDASPLGRHVLIASNWTVVSTSPAPGSALSSGQTVTVFLLRTEEAGWFHSHPVMPKLTGKTADIDQAAGALAPISELVQDLYPRGKAPSTAVTPTSLDSSEAGTGVPELPAEVAQVKGLLSTPDGPITGSFPAAGQPVRLGRIVYVLAVDDPAPTNQAGGGGGDSGGTYNPNLPNPNLPNHFPIHRHHHH